VNPLFRDPSLIFSRARVARAACCPWCAVPNRTRAGKVPGPPSSLPSVILGAISVGTSVNSRSFRTDSSIKNRLRACCGRGIPARADPDPRILRHAQSLLPGRRPWIGQDRQVLEFLRWLNVAHTQRSWGGRWEADRRDDDSHPIRSVGPWDAPSTTRPQSPSRDKTTTNQTDSGQDRENRGEPHTYSSSGREPGRISWYEGTTLRPILGLLSMSGSRTKRTGYLARTAVVKQVGGMYLFDNPFTS